MRAEMQKEHLGINLFEDQVVTFWPRVVANYFSRTLIGLGVPVYYKKLNQPKVVGFFPSHSMPSRPNQPVNRVFPSTAYKPAE